MEPAQRAPILVAFSPESARPEPVEFGVAASRVTGSPLVAITVQRGDPVANLFAGPLDNAPDTQRTLDHMRTDLKRRRLDVDVRVVQARTVSGGLKEAIKALEPELLVLGSIRHARLGSVLTGDLAKRVLDDAPCPVAIVPNGYEAPEGGVQTVGVAYTAAAGGADALQAAGVLAAAGSARLRAVTVIDHPRIEAETELREAVAAHAGGADADIDVLVQDDPAQALIAATADVDLLVMGSREKGHRLGNVSRQVAERAACPLLIMPPGATTTSASLLAHVAAQPSD